ncbi:unnamed protein product [Danaus chrysippus]|uniref:(African queen) hypothetical protein n=1 Tax=Danaus chrysippus TaxID=151541 RepID=A0A8J2W342_9NEOP|nr:unnamed protein product [Danaus chrysippus]
MSGKEEMDVICKGVAELTLLSFRKLEEVRRLARHMRNIINHPLTNKSPAILRYLRDLDEAHRNIFLKKREGVEVEYIFTTEKKSSLQRQRFNSLPVSDVPEILRAQFSIADNAKQVHICVDCDVEIELGEDIPLMESLQKHFNLEVHLPKMKRESVDVAEPIVLPKMSRRLSAMGGGESGQHIEQLMHLMKPTERLDKTFSAKLETALIRHLSDKSEASIDAAVKYYQEVYDKLCQEVSGIDFSTQTSSVAPIIMSIKDNVNQNFAADANKNYENDENDRPAKNQMKKYRYYGPIETFITTLLKNHKLLTLADDRTGKLAFFCMACEYYTLRFRYDSVLNHVFSDTHIHNLAYILQSDKNIPYAMGDTAITDLNNKFLFNFGVTRDSRGLSCSLCKYSMETNDNVILHILDENHLGRLSDKLYRKMKTDSPDGQTSDEWGPRSLDWAKFLATVGKPLNNRDHVVIENFIRPSGKLANYCSCCEMTLKGPRQVLFNHIRQKKHLRNAAPHKLSLLYKNQCRPAEYYASFGNFYICTICPTYIALPSFAAIVEHFDSIIHVETIAKFINCALYPDSDDKILATNSISTSNGVHCDLCDISLSDITSAVNHVLADINHQNLIAENRLKANKGDIISVYMRGNHILHNEGAEFKCVDCKEVFKSIRSLLTHLVYAEHFVNKPSPENVFRFYLELKHNILMLSRNKYDYYDFGKLKCGVCEQDVEENENAKRHVVSQIHRDNMGASYINVSLDASAME